MTNAFFEPDDIAKKTKRPKKSPKPAPPKKKLVPKTNSEREIEAAMQEFKNQGIDYDVMESQ